ncbi:MAG: serine hydroxymethyltransferase, partial [Corynebacterium sp.]|nr:serine hydroxymethyltransferase [Corynebacterium sp.]
PALATRGFDAAAFTEVADIIGTALAQGKSADLESLQARVTKLAEQYPLYEGLEDWTIV